MVGSAVWLCGVACCVACVPKRSWVGGGEWSSSGPSQVCDRAEGSWRDQRRPSVRSVLVAVVRACVLCGVVGAPVIVMALDVPVPFVFPLSSLLFPLCAMVLTLLVVCVCGGHTPFPSRSRCR